MAWLFFLVPTAFWTGTRDPFLIKEVLAQALILGAALWLGVAWIEKRAAVRRPTLLIPLLAFLTAIFLSAIHAGHPMLSAQFFVWIFLLSLLYALSVQQSPAQQERVFMMIRAASALAGLYGLAQYGGFDFVRWASHWDRRPSATFGNPNFAAGWWVMAWSLFAFRGWRERGTTRWMDFGLAALSLANLYLGRTRGAWIAAGLSLPWAGALFFLVERSRGWNKVRTVLAHMVLIGAVAAVVGAGVWAVWKNPSDPSVAARIFKWKTARAMAADHPWTGLGAGNLKTHFALYQAKVKETFPVNLFATSESNVHNEYAQLWAETGFVGLAAFLFIFAAWYRRNVASWPHDSAFRWDRAGQTAAVLAFALYSLTNFPLHIAPSACLLFYLLGVSEVPAPEAGKKNQPKPALLTLPVWRLSAAALWVAALWLWVLPPLRADRLRLQAWAAKESGRTQEAVPLYRRVLALDYYRSERSAYELGECLRQTGDLRGAIEAYGHSVRLRNYGEVYLDMGNCYYLLSQFQDALNHWDQAARLGLPNPSDQEQTERNVQALKKALSSRPAIQPTPAKEH